MMKRLLLVSSILSGALYLGAQTAPPPGTISRSPTQASAGTNFSSAPNTFTNQSAGTASADQLAEQLRNLRAVIDQTLPLMNAYMQSVSNSTATGSRSVVGTVSQILSGVLNRNANQGAGQTPNLAENLRGLLATNAISSNPTYTSTLRDLTKLQGDLQSVNTTLGQLNVNAETNSNTGLTPTGR